MTQQLKVVIIGGGDMGRTHLRAYALLEDVQVVAIVDPDEPRATALANEYPNAQAYADYREAIPKEQPHIASICVPAFLHAEATLFALKQDCHVLCEKPIALTLADGQRMVDIAGEKLGIVFQRRYLKVWQEVEKRLPALGTPLVYHAIDFRPIRPKRLMHSKSGNGGPVIDCCVHDFDMAMRLLGTVQSVYATGDILASDKPELSDIKDFAIDTANISLTFTNGNMAQIIYCWGLPTGFREMSRIEILGPGGMLHIGDGFVEHHLPGNRIEIVTGLENIGHQAQIRAFVHAVRVGIPPPVAPHEALRALRMAYAALASIADGKSQPMK